MTAATEEETVPAELVTVEPEPDEIPAPENVPVTVGAEVAVVDPLSQALAESSTPAASELAVLMRQAELLAGSNIIPKAYRDSPANVLVASMTGRSFGWDALTTMRNGHVIEGTWSMRPETMLALVRKAGHRIEGSSSAERAEVTGTRADDGTSITVIWTMDDAKRAQLIGKDNWKHYPAAMLWARAVAQLCRMLFADVLMGVSYIPEELGADVNERGEVIDVQLAPAGEAWQRPADRQREQQAQADRPAPYEALVELQLSIHALPEALRDELREQWKHEESRVRGFAPYRLPQRLLQTAKAMVNARWATAHKAGVHKAMEIEAARCVLASGICDVFRVPRSDETPAETAPAAPEPPEEAPTAESHTEPSEAPSDDESPEPEPGAASDEDWVPVMRETALQVQAVLQKVPENLRDRVLGGVDELHWTKINGEIAEAGHAEAFPPSSPIGLRRMAVVMFRAQALVDSGTLPAPEA